MQHLQQIQDQEREIFPNNFLSHVIFTVTLSEALSTERKQVCAQELKQEGWTEEKNEDATLSWIKGKSLIKISAGEIIALFNTQDYPSAEHTTKVLDALQTACSEHSLMALVLAKRNSYSIKTIDNQGIENLKRTIFSPQYNQAIPGDIGRVQTRGQEVSIFTEFSSENGTDTFTQTLLAGVEKAEDLKKTLAQLGQAIFNVWRWSISENMIQIMRKKKGE